MTIGAGKRREEVTFESRVTSRSAMGIIVNDGWGASFTRLANVRFGSSAERREAGAEQAVQAVTFRVLADEQTDTVIVTDCIVWDGMTFDITGIARIRPMAGAAEIEFTATASRG